MRTRPKRTGALVLRLIVALALLGWPRSGSAQGTWSVISLPPNPGEAVSPQALAVDAAGELYVADQGTGAGNPRLQKRDAQGIWSVIATAGTGPDQVSAPTALAVDAQGDLYVADRANAARVRKRDAQGAWSAIATAGQGLGQVDAPAALAVDAAGNLYVADSAASGRILKRDAGGTWTVLGPGGAAALAADAAGSLFVADAVNGGRVWKRDARGSWTFLGSGVGPLAVDSAGALYLASGGIRKRDPQGAWTVLDSSAAGPLAVDGAGNLYVADNTYPGQIRKRDLQGKWSVVTTSTYGDAAGQVMGPSAVAVDAAGALYVTELGQDDGTGNGNFVGGNRVEQRDAQGHWSFVPGQIPDPQSLALDGAGNFYVAAYLGTDQNYLGLIEKRDGLGNGSVLATVDSISNGGCFVTTYRLRPAHLAADAAGILYADVDRVGVQVRDARGSWTDITPDSGLNSPSAVALGTAGALYVIDDGTGIQKRDAQGKWSVIDGALPFDTPSAMAVDGGGNFYVASSDDGQLHWRNAQGKWSVLAPSGAAVGQVGTVTGLAVDAAGNLYVADPDNNRVQMYTPHP